MSLSRFETASALPERPMSEINVTPLVDVMLVLLVLFILTAPLMVGGLRVSLPAVESSSMPPSASLTLQLRLDAQGRLELDGQPVSTQELPLRLAERTAGQTDVELALSADTDVPYGQVLALLAQVQSAGLQRIAFATQPVHASR